MKHQLPRHILGSAPALPLSEMLKVLLWIAWFHVLALQQFYCELSKVATVNNWTTQHSFWRKVFLHIYYLLIHRWQMCQIVPVLRTATLRWTSQSQMQSLERSFPSQDRQKTAQCPTHALQSRDPSRTAPSQYPLSFRTSWFGRESLLKIPYIPVKRLNGHFAKGMSVLNAYS